jgi:hypothetical protein
MKSRAAPQRLVEPGRLPKIIFVAAHDPLRSEDESMPTPSRSQQSILIDSVFHKREQYIVEAFCERLEQLERRQQLAHVSGIRDEAFLDRLLGLGITAESLAALGLVPLVCVAWADGEVAARERERIVALAQAAGIEPQNGRYPLLEHLLKRRPAPEMVAAWQDYIKQLREMMSAEDLETLRLEILNRAGEVARASGGLLGFGDRVSPAEQAVLAQLEQAFG